MNYDFAIEDQTNLRTSPCKLFIFIGFIFVLYLLVYLLFYFTFTEKEIGQGKKQFEKGKFYYNYLQVNPKII